MTYNWVVYNKQNMEKVGEVVTNHSISMADAIDLLDAKHIEMVNLDDADLVINGKKYWSDDLDMLLEEDYNEVTNA